VRAQLVHDLGFGAHVERGAGFVEEQELRIGVERARDRDALALAARQLVGPFVYAASAPNVGVGVLAVIDGVAQSVGTILIVVGITTFRDDLVPIPVESRARNLRVARMSWQLVPFAGATAAGLAMHLEW
jgi:hypothetical protein